MSRSGKKGPLVIHHQDEVEAPAKPSAVVEQEAAPDPAQSQTLDELEAAPQGRAMVAATRIAARRGSWLGRLVWGALSALVLLWISTALWDFVGGLAARNLWLGRFALVAGAIVAIAALVFVLREIGGLSRLRRIDGLRGRAEALRDLPDDKAAEALSSEVAALYSHRDDLKWALDDVERHQGAVIDAQARLDLVESKVLGPLDEAARGEIEKSARQVAMVTAIVPLALADVIAALAANTSMVRRIAEVYGGRTGTFGSWRLVRAVALHLVATGAVGVADDLIGSIAGGGAVAKLSRRFGEGIINGALTARVGLAAMDLCRPMPFHARKRPGVTEIMRRAMTGVFSN